MTTGLGVVVFSLLFLTACQSPPTTPINIGKQTVATAIIDRRLPEISGLAASRTLPSHLWAINDSGNSASIFLIDQNLSVKQEVALDIRNRDWEDLAAFSAFGEAWIVIAESGDNLRRYDSYHLYFFRETDLLSAGTSPLAPEVALSYTYEHGPMNCEAVVVDTTSKAILFFGKTDNNTPVYSLPLSAMQSTRTAQATLLTTIPAVSNNPTNSLISALTGVNLNSTTAATISGDGKSLFLLTYNDIWRVDRNSNQSWQDALQIKAKHFASHGLHQAEALTADATSQRLLVTSEELPAPVLEFNF